MFVVSLHNKQQLHVSGKNVARSPSLVDYRCKSGEENEECVCVCFANELPDPLAVAWSILNFTRVV